METTILTEQKVLLFRRQLQEEERSPATIEKYLREVRQFSRWMAHAPVTKEAVLQWKEHLIRQGYQPSTINGKLTSLDQLFRVLGWKGLGVKHLRLQRKMFRDSVRELSRGEYTRLIRAAQESGQEEAQVPALCLQTFVENSCKYATVPGRGLEISLEVRQLPSEEGGRLDAVIEAARIDGAGELRILIRVVLPMSIPIIATLALLVGLAYWNDWLNGLYYISDDRLFSIQVLLNRMLLDVQFLMSNSDAAKSLQQNEEFVLPSTGIRMAVAVMGALPILVVYPFFQKYFVKGIVIGAVKG